MTFPLGPRKRRLSRVATLAAFGLLAACGVAQSSPQDRILTRLNDSEATPLRGNVHPLARPEFDRGKIADSTPLPRITIFFKSTPSQQAALVELLSEQQDRASSNYHRWIAPQEFGVRFGLSQNDLNKVTSWLESRGFAIRNVPESRNAVSFSGSAAQVTAAFQTSLHRYFRNGEEHYANSTEPAIPAALAGLVSGIAGLNDFRPRPRIIRRSENRAKPDFTDGTTNHFLAPSDFGLIYDVQPLYSRGLDGAGQKIAIVGQSDIQLNDIAEFRSLMNLPASVPQVILVPGSADPGMQDGDLQEADLDLEWAGGIAPNTTLLYVNSTNAWDSLEYAVTSDLAPVISVSYSACEAQFSSSDVQTLMILGEQANAQGQTIVAASGDSGAAACDDLFAPEATQGVAVNIPASMPYVTGVGGTEFNEGSGTYWNSTNGANNQSAVSYIPEVSWNDTSAGFGIQAGGGGPSVLFSKPSWQAGSGVPNDGVRDVPDVSLSASADHDSYLICDETYNSSTKTFTPVCPNGFAGGFDAVGGTSASTPSFAAIVALLNESMNSSQGNINYVLYRLPGLASSPLHDITSGNNAVPCQTSSTSPDCPTTGSSAGSIGYSAGPGYDMATGLGSVDASALISAWPSISLPPDFDITISPPNLTMKYGGTATTQIIVNDVGGLTGVPILACDMPASFPGVTCSIAPAGANVFTLRLASSNNSAVVFPTVGKTPGLQFAGHFGTLGMEQFWALTSSTGHNGPTFTLGLAVFLAGIAISACICGIASRGPKLVPLLGLACAAAALFGCAGGTSGGGAAHVQDPPTSVQMAPQSVVLGPNDQQEFTASVTNSSNGSFTWTLSPSVGNSSALASGSAAAIYTAPGAIVGGQTITLTATSVADSTKQASARILLLPPEKGTIQVTGILNGMSHTVGISLRVN